MRRARRGAAAGSAGFLAASITAGPDAFATVAIAMLTGTLLLCKMDQAPDALGRCAAFLRTLEVADLGEA